MSRFFLSLSLIVFFPISAINAQSSDLKETFLEAESYFLFEEYSEALNLYLKIRRADPENDNINYKIGVCLLNDPYQKDKSIKYLVDACDNINPKYKENNYKERTAPPEAFFYLGNAYLVNNDIDNALKNYRHFRNILDEKVYDVELVDEQIQICERARELMSMPVDYDRLNMSDRINTRFADVNPIVSGNGNRLVYVSKLQFYDATFFSEKIDGEWQPPRNIVPELGVDGDVYPTSLSYDGNTMVIYRNDDFIGNLYISHYEDGHWTTMSSLDNINTKYWESHGSLSKDGKTLYFTSNRKGGLGGLDIYRSQLQQNGSWGEPVNLGPVINTRYNEETPFITANGKILYFSSYGHYNMGGYDVFYSRIDNQGNWGTPINLGYPINTTDDDLFFMPFNNGNNGYYSQYTEDGFGRHDIYYMDVYSDNNPRMYMISGTLGSDDGNTLQKKDLNIYLIDRLSGDTIVITQASENLNNFALKAPKGEYDLLVKSEEYEDLITTFIIDETTDKSGMQLQDSLILAKKPYVPQIFKGEESRILASDSIYNVEAGEKVKIRLQLEKDALLVADQYLDSVLVKSDTFEISKRRFTYELIPEEGLNRIDFALIEENGDTSLKTITINASSPEDTEESTDESSADETLSEPVPEPEISAEDSLRMALEEIITHLNNNSEGALQNTLTTIIPSELELKSTNDLLQHIEPSEGTEYTREELDRTIVNSVSAGSTELLHQLLGEQSEGKLKEFIDDFNPRGSGLLTSEEYIQYIRAQQDEQGISDMEITNALAGALDEVSNEAELLRRQLLLYGDEEIKSVLEPMDLKKTKLRSQEDLKEYLIQRGIQREQIEEAQAIFLSGNDAEALRELLLMHSDGKLFEYLKTLDVKAERIGTARELIDHLKLVCEDNGFTIYDINRAISSLCNELADVEKTLRELMAYSEGDLLDYLQSMNLFEHKLFTPADLINHLVDTAGTAFSNELLINALAGIHDDSQLEALVEFMIDNAPKAISDLLLRTELSEAGISSITELISFLLANAEELGYSQEEMQKLILDLLADFTIETIMQEEDENAGKGISENILIGGGIAFFGLLVFFIFFFRKKKKTEPEE